MDTLFTRATLGTPASNIYNTGAPEFSIDSQNAVFRL